MEWIFDSSVVLQPDTDYWFYMDIPTNETDPFMGLVSITTDTYAGGNFYYSYPADQNYFSDVDSDLAFRLTGTSAIPEPSMAFALIIAGGFVLSRRRR